MAPPSTTRQKPSRLFAKLKNIDGPLRKSTNTEAQNILLVHADEQPQSQVLSLAEIGRMHYRDLNTHDYDFDPQQLISPEQSYGLSSNQERVLSKMFREEDIESSPVISGNVTVDKLPPRKVVRNSNKQV